MKLKIGLLLMLLLSPAFAARQKDLVAELRANSQFVELHDGPLFHLDQRYATANNFMGVDLYPGFKAVFLHREAYEKLEAAAKALRKLKSGWRLRIFDGLRPRSVQRLMWAKVKGTKGEKYVADPDKGSVHNFGMAVDLGLSDDRGREVDMGTPYDDFTPLAQPRYEARYLKEGKLNKRQIANRRLLRGLMQKAGFRPIPNEWWHFDSREQSEVRKKFVIVE